MMREPSIEARTWTVGGLVVAFGLAVAASAGAWIVLADDIYLTRLSAFIASCF